MKVVYNAQSKGGSDDTEGHIRKALVDLGHEVVQDGDGDIYLFHKIPRVPRGFKGKIVCWYFDKIWNNRLNWFYEVYPKVDHFFMTDGTWAKKFPDIHVLRQGIGDFSEGVKEERNIDVAFVGSVYGERLKMVELLEATYGERFKVYSNQFNKDLNNLCASIPIFVAPEFPSSHDYWSNRIYLLVGSGAFVLHPKLKGLVDEWGENLVYYEDNLIEKINYFLENPIEREIMRKKAYNYCVQNFTYKKRVEQLIEICKENNK